MQAKTTETTIVHPASTTPQRVLPLSHLDNDRNLRVSIRYLRAYISTNDQHRIENDSSAADPFYVITSALSSALVHYYPFAGTLRTKVDSRLEIHSAESDGVPVIRATVNCTLESVGYLDDPKAHCDLIESLVPDPDHDEQLANPLILQVTVFQCGGYTLGASVHHSMCDGLGATIFFNAMAELARGATQLSVEPVWDRARLLGPRVPPRLGFPIQDFLELGEVETLGRSEPVIRECFHIQEEWLDRFKGFLTECSGLKFTSFEALGAFIWRAKVKSSGITSSTMVKFAYSINIRKILNPLLPQGYWGNGCVPMYIQLTAEDLIIQPIWKTAELIKKSKHKATDEYVRTFIDFQELNYEMRITAGRGVFGFTDWRYLGHSTVDFGWGGPVTVLPLSRNILGSDEPCFFLPYSSASKVEKDGFKVMVFGKESDMPALREEMNELSKEDYGILKVASL